MAIQPNNLYKKLHFTIGMKISDLINLVSFFRLSLQNEKETQMQIAKIFTDNGIDHQREFRLDSKNIPDFFMDGIAIEVKIKGSPRQIYKECERYCAFEEVRELILITNRSMGFPREINGKPCYLVNIGKGWL